MKQEIELKEGMTAKVEGGKLVIEMPEWKPKVGDVVTNQGDGAIFIQKESYGSGTSFYAALYMGIFHTEGKVAYDSPRPSTRDERCTFFARLVAEGYKWNAKKLKLTRVGKKWTPKNGDFVAHTDKYGDTLISIFKEFRPDGTVANHAGVGDGPWRDLLIDDWSLAEWADRPATESEIKIMNDALAKAGKRWNAELKRVEDIEFKVGDCVIGRDTYSPSSAKFVEHIDINHDDPGGFMCRYDNLSNKCSFKYLRHATESEKAKTVSDLYNKGKVWNKKLNRIEDIKPAPVEMTMEQVCEKLGMNVKIVKK